MLEGDKGSGERWMVASSRMGGEGEARMVMPRACRAAARVCFSRAAREA